MLGSRAGAEGGGVGAMVSMVMLKAPDGTETLPTASVALAVILCAPSRSALTVMPGLL